MSSGKRIEVRAIRALLVGGGPPAELTVKAATTTIPIVFSTGGDPVRSGLVASLNQPSGNITGVYHFATGLEAKRQGLLHEMLPKATPIAVLINPNYRMPKTSCATCRRRLPACVQLVVVRANAESDFNAAFSTAVPAVWGAPSLRIPIL